MRARAVQLVTSWWVVGVWAALGITTGVISVVTVLQPAWYVRYSLIHAQDARGVSFKVVVSSVGPLGFCRLAAVDTSQVHHTNDKRHTTSTTSSMPGTIATEEGILTTPNSLETSDLAASVTPQLPLSSSALPGLVEISRSTAGSVHEWPPLEAHDVTLAFGSGDDGFGHVPTGSTILGDPDNETVDATKSSEVSEASTKTGEDITNEEKNTENLFSHVTETYVKIVNHEKDNASILHFPEEKLEFSVLRGGKEMQEIPEYEIAITEDRNTTFHSQGGGDTGLEADSGKRYFIPNFKTDKGRTVDQANTTVNKNKRKKKKDRRRKKNRKKKLKSEKQLVKQGNRRESGSPTSHNINIAPGHLTARPAMMITSREKLVIAERLVQPEKLRSYHDIVDYDYRPRKPILLCSGVGVGAGSSAVWVLVGVLYGFAGVVQVVAGVASLALQAARTHARKYTLAIWIGNIQVAVVMSQGVALVLFPLGLGSPLARGECGGSSSVYWSGDCSFGWSYMLGVVATTLAAYCPCLARLTIFRRYSLREWESINFF
ncbi:uncharacterized protein [Procambarus clarkii]|uniref:uncharacterized protein n=1 Tax=Procambarus clarkii TaxID=6728 RepID=UPI001E67205D|nr:uncharacterized protein LOC123768637 [Procambarus clarkii]